MSKRLLIADDHELMLAGISQMLAPEFDIVGVARDGRMLVAEAERLKPDVVVLDIGMPELNGIEAARRIVAVLPKTKIVVLTQQLSGNHVQAAFRAGASGYVAKQAAATELLEAVRTVLVDQYFVSSLAVPRDKPVRKVLKMNPAELFGDALTARQREVLELVAQGKSTKEIGVALSISAKTVDFHKGMLMDELGLRTTAELTRYAMVNGIAKDDRV